jgi:hypothetical protein
MAVKIIVSVTENKNTDNKIISLDISLQGSYETESGSVTSTINETYTFAEPKDEVTVSEKRKIVSEVLKNNVNTVISDIKSRTGLDNLGETIIIM